MSAESWEPKTVPVLLLLAHQRDDMVSLYYTMAWPILEPIFGFGFDQIFQEYVQHFSIKAEHLKRPVFDTSILTLIYISDLHQRFTIHINLYKH